MAKLTTVILVLGLLTFMAFFPKSSLAAAPAFTLTFKDQAFTLSQEDVNVWKGRQKITPSKILSPPPRAVESSLLEFVGQPQDNSSPQFYNYRLHYIYNYVQALGETINVPVVEPSLNIQDNRATEFTPPQNGQQLDTYKTAFEVLKILESGKDSVGLVVYETEPQVSLEQTNPLGISELIARGISGFKGSPNNRRHNIAVGVEKFKGVLIPQGQEFSFNKILGPVEAENGFLPELVIKKTGTVPEFGGGLCQVSSTTFRAAMQAGLPITQRKNHAYAVSYYSPQGTDATIYPGVVDLKFINDTPGAILVWPYYKDKNTLVFDFYGTKDGRQVTLQKPVITDRKPDGSMKAAWTRLIEKNGQISTSTFKSIYQSPDLFHKTESFVTASSSPAAVNPPPKTTAVQ
jgi:vancomycin resistance protein YoaR